MGRHPAKYFSENQTKFFIACIIESLIYIHSKNIIHRDIKPENLIFDEKGYLHVTDFGIAKYSTNNNSNETSGTPGYMAPEVMKGLNHTGSVDYFAVGIITYELMMGKRPYVGKNRSEIKEQMMIKQVFLDEDNIPIGWSQYSADFINRLLLRKDTKRLGYYNDLEVKNHPWLSNIKFNDLINFKIESPFIPIKNHDNYDKKYCQEIEPIGIDTNLRYEDYLNDERYNGMFKGFTFYNVDESKLINNNEIYKKPNVKYMKNDLNINNNNYINKKSRTINIDNDFKNKINQNISQRQIKNISLYKNQNLSLIQNKDISPIKNQNPLSYRKRDTLNNRSLNYSNANESTNKKTPRANKKDNENSILINDNSKISLKNGEDIYIIASPNSRGRVSIYSNNNNIDNSFRRYANHSFVETNYSKGKIFRRSYSSSRLHNNNGNIFSLLVNNINNIMNNNESINGNYSVHHISKLSTPINYNNINKEKSPIDERPNSNYINYNNFNNNICHNKNRSFIEKSKNNFFYLVHNNNMFSQYNNFNNNNSFKYRNKDLNYILNESLNNDNKIKEKDSDLKKNSIIFKIPKNPINLKNTNLEKKSNTINLDYSSLKSNKKNYNKIINIDYFDIPNISNNYLYVDKYGNNSYSKEENNIKMNEKPKEEKLIYNYKMINKLNNMNNVNNRKNNSFIIDKNKFKRITNLIKYNMNYGHLNINSMNNNYESNNKSNRNINQSNNEIIKKDNNLSYKQIPLPFTSNKKRLKKRMIKINEKEKNNNYNHSNPQINIINNNIINNNLIISSPINYNSQNLNCNKDSKFNKESINNSMYKKYISIIEMNNNNNKKSKIPLYNNQNNLNNNKGPNKKEKSDIVSMKINEKTFCKYKYLVNFDKYKKIKNNNRNKEIEKNENCNIINNNNNIIKRRIKEKYHTSESNKNKEKKIINGNNIINRKINKIKLEFS